MKKNIQPRLDDNYTSQSWARGDKLYASDLTKMSRQVDSNENELVELTTNVVPKIAAEIADHQSTLDQFAPKIAKIDVPEGSTIVGEIDKAVADLVNGAPETLDTIKEVADAIEENGDAITALNEIVATNKGAIDAVQAAHQATADKLNKLDQVAVKYSEFTYGDDPAVRHTIQLKNYDNITGVTTTGLGANLAMVSKWDVADFGSATIPANINAKDGKVTINDSHQIATVDQIPDVSKFETIENVKSSLQALDQKIQANTETSSQQLNAVKEQINSKIDQTKTELVDQIDTKQDAGDYPEYQQFRAGVNQDRVRKTIQLANADSISGVDTSGSGRNIAMISEWNKVDLGTNVLTMNLNSKDGIVQINDTETVATTKNVRDAYNHLGSEVVKQLNDHKTQSDNTYVPFVTVGKAGKVKVTTDDSGNMIISSIEDSKVGAQASININSQNAMMMTSYKTGRQEAGLVHASPIGVWLKRRTPEGEDISVEVKQLADNITKTAELQKTTTQHTASIDTINTELGTKLSTNRFDQYTQDTDAKIKRLQDHQAQTDNNVYTKDEIDNKLAGAFHYKGTVQTFAELPKEHNEKGDVWNVVEADVDHHIKAGDNVAWNGESWDALSGIVDLSAYDNIEATSEKISAAVAPKADKTYVDAQLGTKANAAALTSHEQAFESYKTQAQASIDAKADQQYVINQLASKVSQEAYDAYKLENKTQLDGKVDKNQHQADLNVININVGKKVETNVFEEAKADLQAAIARKQDAGDYITVDTFDQHVEQYQADKPTFAIKANVDQALTLKADKEEIKQQLAGKAESVHTHAISEVTGLNDALNAKVGIDAYTSDKATFALKTELEPLATKQSVKQQIEAAVTSVYRYKGSVATIDELPKQDQITGDVYNVESDGANVAWDGEKWDKLGGPIDLSSYATAAVVDEKITAAKNELQPKIDHNGEEIVRVEGKVDSHNTVFTKYQQTVDGKFAQEVKDRGAAIKVETDARVAAIAQEVTDRQGAVDEVTGKLTEHEQAFETFKTETYEPKVAELAKSIGDETTARQAAITETTNAFKAADEKVTSAYTKAIETAKTEVTTKVTEVEGALNAYKGSNDAAVAKVKTDVTEAFGAADKALETKVTQGYTAAVEGEKTAREAAVALLATKVELEGINTTLTGKFGEYYTKSEVDGKVSSVYRYKGSVANEQALPKDSQVTGDVYNVEDTGMNVAWDGKKWDKLGSVVNLTPYATTEAVEAKITEAKQAATEALNQHTQTAETTYAKKAEVTKQIETVDGKFAGKADKVHTHTIENITGLQDALDGKQAAGDYALKSEVKTVDDKFAGYTTTEALNGLLDGKAAVVHTHTVENVTGLQAALDAKMANSEAAKFAAHDHNHDSVYLAIGGKAESAKVADSVAWANVTGTEGVALKSEVTTVSNKFADYTTTEDLGQLLDGKAELVHTHAIKDVTGLQDALDAKIATNEAATKFATKDHNHDQAYLAIKGKAESAKIADSVAWTAVTGTEGVASKEDVAGLETKKANTDWVNKTFATQTAVTEALANKLDASKESELATKNELASHVAKKTSYQGQDFVIDGDNAIVKCTDQNRYGGDSSVSFGTQFVKVSSTIKDPSNKKTTLIELTPETLSLKRMDQDGKLHQIELLEIIGKLDKAVYEEEKKNFAAAAEVSKLSGEVIALKAMVEALQAQVEGMKFKDVVPQAPQADIKGNDVVVSAGTVNADTPMKVTATNNAKVEDVTIESSHATVTAKNDVSLSNVTLTGDLNKNTAKTNAAVKVNTEGHVTINGVDYRQTGYNAIEVGLNTQPKSVIIDGVDVDVAMGNNAFSIFGSQKDGVVTISNCHVKQCSNPIRVSNVLNVPFTINVVNCKFDKWDTNPEWQGMMIFQDHNAHSAQEALERKAFAKINVNLINCIGPDGQKIEGNAEQLANNNIIYVWNEHQNRVGFDVEQYPVVNAS